MSGLLRDLKHANSQDFSSAILVAVCEEVSPTEETALLSASRGTLHSQSFVTTCDKESESESDGDLRPLLIHPTPVSGSSEIKVLHCEPHTGMHLHDDHSRGGYVTHVPSTSSVVSDRSTSSPAVSARLLQSVAEDKSASTAPTLQNHMTVSELSDAISTPVPTDLPEVTIEHIRVRHAAAESSGGCEDEEEEEDDDDNTGDSSLTESGNWESDGQPIIERTITDDTDADHTHVSELTMTTQTQVHTHSIHTHAHSGGGSDSVDVDDSVLEEEGKDASSSESHSSLQQSGGGKTTAKSKVIQESTSMTVSYSESSTPQPQCTPTAGGGSVSPSNEDTVIRHLYAAAGQCSADGTVTILQPDDEPSTTILSSDDSSQSEGERNDLTLAGDSSVKKDTRSITKATGSLLTVDGTETMLQVQKSLSPMVERSPHPYHVYVRVLNTDDLGAASSASSSSSGDGEDFLPHCCFENYRKYSRFEERSSFCQKWNELRRLLRVHLINAWWFDYFILVVIALNCVLIAIDNPSKKKSKTSRLVKRAELPFNMIFTVEMILKWIAYGLVKSPTPEALEAETYRPGTRRPRTLSSAQRSDDEDIGRGHDVAKAKAKTKKEEDEYVGYFRDGWNMLDFVVVFSSWFSLLPNAGNYTSIRVLRVLRPLRTVTKIKELRLLISTIILSLRGLADVLALLTFLLITFAIIGLQTFSGALHQQCFALPKSEVQHLDWRNDASLWQPETHFCPQVKSESAANACPSQYPYCLDLAPNPDARMTSFDNIFFAFVQIFVTVTLEGWVAIMYRLQASTKNYIWMYFILLTFVVSFFAINLCLAVIEDVYSNLRDDADEEEKEAKRQRERQRQHSTAGDMFGGEDSNNSQTSSSSSQFSLSLETEEASIPLPSTYRSPTEDPTFNFMDKAQLPSTKDSIDFVGIITPMGKSRSPGLHSPAGSAPPALSAWKAKKLPSMSPNPATASHRKVWSKGSVSDLNEKARLSATMSELQKGTRLSQGRRASAGMQRSTTNYVVTTLKREDPALLTHRGKASGVRIFGEHMIQPDDEGNEEESELYRSYQAMARKALRMARPKPNPYLEGRHEVVKHMNALVNSALFKWTVMAIIIVNTIVLALEWPTMEEKTRNAFEQANFTFTVFFIVELVFKMVGLGHREYFADRWNIFDFVIVILSVIELVLVGGGGVSALRAFRLLRVFRLLGRFENMRLLLGLVVQSLDEVCWLTVILVIFMFMFATLGMSTFGGGMAKVEEPRGRWRFDNFYWAMIAVFQVVTGDAWNEVMYDAIEGSTRAAALFFLAVVCFGTFIVLNIFMAILLKGLSSEDMELKFQLEDSVTYAKELLAIRERGKCLGEQTWSKEDILNRVLMRLERQRYRGNYHKNQREWKHHRDKEKIEGVSLGFFPATHPLRVFLHKLVNDRRFDFCIDLLICVNCFFLAFEEPGADEKKSNARTFQVADYIFTAVFVCEMVVKIIALGCMASPFGRGRERVWIQVTDNEELVRWSVMCSEAFKNELEEFSEREKRSNGRLGSKSLDADKLAGIAIEVKNSDDGYTVVHFWHAPDMRMVFAGDEFVSAYELKSESKGTWKLVSEEMQLAETGIDDVCRSFDMSDLHHNAYMASNWNRLDFLVVIVAIIGVGRPEITFLRALRAFRPFRIMVRVNQIKVVLSALVRAIPAMFNTMLFCFVFWFIVAILGVSRWSGKFRRCLPTDDGTALYSEDEALAFDKDECRKELGLKWTNAIFNFDHVFQAVHTLFVVATLSGWNDVMYMAVDSTRMNMAPQRFHHPEAALYFVAVIVVCSFFSLNLIVSVVVDNFNKIKAEKDGSAFQTKQQREWVRNQSLLSRISLSRSLPEPTKDWRRFCYRLVTRKYFEPFILCCIVFNAGTMACEHYNQSKAWTRTLLIFDILFVVVFAVECFLKLAAYGPRLYFLDNWNRFDFVIVVVGIVSLCIDTGIGLNVFRLFRIGRVLRLLNKAKTLKMLFWTLLESAPSLVNIGMLLFVIFFIYAVIGMHLFGNAKPELFSEANFSSFSESMALLYRVGTEDGWTDVYESYLRYYQHRSGLFLVYGYFMSFFVFGTLVLINLFIAVVLDSFQDNASAVQREAKLAPVKVWRDIWLWFDTEVVSEVSADDFMDMLLVTPKPAGFAEQNPFEIIYNQVKSQRDRQRGQRRTSVLRLRRTLTGSVNMKRKSSSFWSPRSSSPKVEKRKSGQLPAMDSALSEDFEMAMSAADFDEMQRPSHEHRIRTWTSEVCAKKLLSYFGKRKTRSLRMKSLLTQKKLPTHTEILEFLLTLKLSVHRKEESESKEEYSSDGSSAEDCQWMVRYRDALICLCGEIAGPALAIDANNEKTECIDRIDRWYARKHNIGDLHSALVCKQRRKTLTNRAVPNTLLPNLTSRLSEDKPVKAVKADVMPMSSVVEVEMMEVARKSK